jgi:hypothetical protein
MLKEIRCDAINFNWHPTKDIFAVVIIDDDNYHQIKYLDLITNELSEISDKNIGHAFTVQWNYDGSEIYYHFGSGHKYNTHHNSISHLSNSSINNIALAPTNSSFAFVNKNKNNNGYHLVININGNDIKHLEGKIDEDDYSWSNPHLSFIDNNSLTYQFKKDLYIYDINESTSKKIYENTNGANAHESGIIAVKPHYETGIKDKIYFHHVESNKNYTGDLVYENKNYEFDSNSKFSWSPNGEYLIFYLEHQIEKKSFYPRSNHLALYDIRSNRIIKIIDTRFEERIIPTWRWDSKIFAYYDYANHLIKFEKIE